MKRGKALFLSFAAGAILGTMTGELRAGPARPAGRIIIGIKEPIPKAALAEIRRIFGKQILQIAPSNTYALLLLKRGQTLAEVKRLSPWITYVEHETFTDIAPTGKELPPSAAALIRAPREEKR